MRTFLAAALLLAGAAAICPPVLAQSTLEGRVDRLESEMHAVQRKVFPGGAGQYVQPQITPGMTPETAPGYGNPASSPITDLTQRVGALEQQMRTMTGQIEEANHHVQVLQDDFTAYKRATDARIAALEKGGAAATVSGPAASTSPKPAAPDDSAEPAVPDSDRAARIAAVEKPSTGDPAEDAYIYGYRLWAAKLYPEAEKQLKSVVAKYPDSRRASYAQNLLGRAYLDEGKPSLASIAFYDNYKKMPNGERAPDSLYYLAQSLMQLKKPADACKVYSELSDVYGATISASMKDDIARGRREAQCK